MSSNEKEMSIRLQKSVRALLAKKKAHLKKLNDEKMTDYTSFLIGNDKALTNVEVTPYKMDKNFLVVGTSMFRSIDIGCTLAKSEYIFPKVIIIDNSKVACEGWKKLKKFFAECPLKDAQDFVNDEENGLLEFINKELMPTVDGTDPYTYFNIFFKNRNLNYVKKVVESSLFIPQDWGDVDTFKKIQKIYADRPIVAYSSNIIQFVNSETQIQVLKSIEALNPSLCICSDYHQIKKRPTKTFLFGNNNPLYIAEVLKLNDKVKNEFKNNDNSSKLNIY